MKKLSNEEFHDALCKGLGRAVQHVRCSDPTEVREELLNAARHCLAGRSKP
jgi:hypothetical protein